MESWSSRRTRRPVEGLGFLAWREVQIWGLSSKIVKNRCVSSCFYFWGQLLSFQYLTRSPYVWDSSRAKVWQWFSLLTSTWAQRRHSGKSTGEVPRFFPKNNLQISSANYMPTTLYIIFSSQWVLHSLLIWGVHKQSYTSTIVICCPT